MIYMNTEVKENVYIYVKEWERLRKKKGLNDIFAEILYFTIKTLKASCQTIRCFLSQINTLKS